MKERRKPRGKAPQKTGQISRKRPEGALYPCRAGALAALPTAAKTCPLRSSVCQVCGCSGGLHGAGCHGKLEGVALERLGCALDGWNAAVEELRYRKPDVGEQLRMLHHSGEEVDVIVVAETASDKYIVKRYVKKSNREVEKKVYAGVKLTSLRRAKPQIFRASESCQKWKSLAMNLGTDERQLSSDAELRYRMDGYYNRQLKVKRADANGGAAG